MLLYDNCHNFNQLGINSKLLYKNMQNISKNKSIIVMIPIVFCTLMEQGYLHIIPRIHSNLLEFLLPWIFSITICYTLPIRKKFWLMFGCSVSFYITLKIIDIMEPSYEQAVLTATLISPFISSILIPRYNTEKFSLAAFILNYTLAILFLISLSIISAICISYVYIIIKDFFHTAYFTHLYEEDFSFVYGLMYQISQTIGFGDFILQLKQISDSSQITQSFYVTTIAINTVAIPSILIALTYKQDSKKQIYYSIFFILACFSSTTSFSLSFLLIALIWLHPTLIALLFINSLFFYIIGHHINFDIVIKHEDFYNPNLTVNLLKIMNAKYIIFCCGIFLANLISTLLVISKTEKYIIATKKQRKHKPIKTNLIDQNDDDVSILTSNVIKFIGGFDNILSVNNEKKEILEFHLIDITQVNRLALNNIGIKAVSFKRFDDVVKLEIGAKATSVHEKIIIFAKLQLADLTTVYQDKKFYSIENSRFMNQFTKIGEEI